MDYILREIVKNTGDTGFNDDLLRAADYIVELEQRLAEAKSELEQLTICGWLFQDEYTRLTEIVDNWQIEKGFEWQNPRWKKIHPVYRKGGE